MAVQINRLTQQLLDALFVPADRRMVRRLLEVVKVYGGKDSAVVTLTREISPAWPVPRDRP